MRECFESESDEAIVVWFCGCSQRVIIVSNESVVVKIEWQDQLPVERECDGGVEVWYGKAREGRSVKERKKQKE